MLIVVFLSMGHVRLLHAAEQVKRLGTAVKENSCCAKSESSLWLLFFSLLGEESHEVIVLPWNPLDFYHSRKPSMLDKLKLFRFQ